MRFLVRFAALCLLLSSGIVYSQSSPAPKEFEVATVKPSAPLDMAKLAAEMQAGRMPRLGAFVDASHAEYIYMSLKDLIALAYKLKSYQISGPDWLATEHFDIDAKMPEGAGKDEAPNLLRALLADRFKLVAHTSTEDHKVLALVVGKNGSKLIASPPDTKIDEQAPLAPGETQLKSNNGAMRMKKNPDGSTTIDMGDKGTITQRMDVQEQSLHLDSSKVTMDGFAAMLTQVLQVGGGQGRQVVDQTGLKGNYQVSLDILLADLMDMAREQAKNMGIAMPPPSAAGASADTQAAPGGGLSVYRSVEKLGLKLEERKLPVEQLAIDHIEKTPSEN